MKKLSTLVSLLALSLAVGCSTAPKNNEERADMHNSVRDTMETFNREDPSLQPLINKSYGYAIIPSIAKGGLVVGGAYGTGEVYEHGIQVGYCSVSQASIGAQIGGQTYAELLVFENKEAMDRFKRNELTFTAEATAVAIQSGAASQAKFQHGVAAFTHANNGLMAEAAVGGQKFTYKPKELPPAM